MPETKPEAIRLSEEDRANIRAIEASGAAVGTTAAIRVALALAAHGFMKAKRIGRRSR